MEWLVLNIVVRNQRKKRYNVNFQAWFIDDCNKSSEIAFMWMHRISLIMSQHIHQTWDIVVPL